MSGQPSTSAYWAEFLKKEGGEWWTESEAVEESVYTVSGVNDCVTDMLNLEILEQREREQPHQVGPNPTEYRYTLD